MRLIPTLSVACLAMLSSLAHGESVSGLYHVREVVDGQGSEARSQATRQAFDTLVLRLTGDAKAAQSAALASLREDPQPIISQFAFEGGSPPTVQVEFDPGSTERALGKAGLALWGSNRPSILGWWLFDDAEGSTLVGDGQSAAEPLRRAAQHRGLPLRLPLADLQEQLLADAKALEGKDPKALREAGERYGANALLAVHAQQADGHWQGTWQLWLGKQHEQGSAQGDDPAALADAVMLAVSNRLAPRYVSRPGVASGVQLRVEGMTLARYAELDRVLEGFAARLQLAQSDTFTYNVSGSREQLRAQLGLAQLHEVQVEPAPSGTPPAPGAQAPFEGLLMRW
ncbi:DUF2066 domain-containing protein [Pseudomonas cremoricolorata]|uniref:DUF2066 domain-containing protein n=1 Tax=Pseudomonas cremoricolorata TaxID=157783 RepID=UPI0004210F9A|nr:DUF2066 domain-containing protein [Pseudomonas cremoricolorata]